MTQLMSSFAVLQSLLRSSDRVKSRKNCEELPTAASPATSAGIPPTEHLQGVMKSDAKEFLLRLLCHSASMTPLGQSYGIQAVPAFSTLQQSIVAFDEPDQMSFTVRIGPAFYRLYRLAHGSPQHGVSHVFSTLFVFLNDALCQAYWFEVNGGSTTRGWTIFRNAAQLKETIRQSCTEALRNVGPDGTPATFNLMIQFDNKALEELVDRGAVEKADRQGQ